MVQAVNGGGLHMIANMAKHQRSANEQSGVTNGSESADRRIVADRKDCAGSSVNLENHPVGKMVNTTV